jgi:magnesium and cobalt transporter
MSIKTFFDRVLGPKEGTEESAYRELEVEKRDMIRGVVELSETTVKEVMVPRIDTVFLAVDAPREELLERIADSGHSRFPVYKDTIDNVVGVLYVKDLLRNLARGQDFETAPLLRKPYFVPESKRIPTSSPSPNGSMICCVSSNAAGCISP